jgi:hypothetical protein
MPRGLTIAQKAIVEARIKRPVDFVELELTSATYRYWCGSRTITALGNTWAGVGNFGSVRGIGSERAARTQRVQVALHGDPRIPTPSNLTSILKGERYQKRPLRIYVGFTDPDTDLPIADPVIAWSGYCDVLSFTIGKTWAVTMTGEHFSSLLRRTNGLRATNESHTARVGDSTDRFFALSSRLSSLTNGVKDTSRG